MATAPEISEYIKDNIAKDSTKLDLSSFWLHEFPAEILALTDLEELDMSRTQVNSIPEGIKALKNLKTLKWASGTEFDDKTDGLIASFDVDSLANLLPLPNLTSLDISSNYLTEIPPSVLLMTNLTQLDLGENLITSIPNEISSLSKLGELVLWSNKITKLSRQIDFSRFRSDIDIDLSANPIGEDPIEVSYIEDVVEAKFSNVTIIAGSPE